MECNFVDLEIHVRTGRRARLVLALPLLGAEFSTACRKAVCSGRASSCAACSDRSECRWQRTFGQELSCDPAALKRHQKPPLPFVFSYPLHDLPPDSAGILACTLVVVGCAIDCLEMLLAGFADLLAHAACPAPGRIERLFSRDYQGRATELISNNRSGTFANLAVLSAAGLLDGLTWNQEHCGVRLLSPLKLRGDGRQLRRFDFGLFVRSIMRRVSALIYYYDKFESGLDYRELSHQADQVVCSEGRFCYEEGFGRSRQLAGIVGQGCFRGELGGLMPFLVLGSYFHVGKNCSFGFGQYQVFSDQPLGAFPPGGPGDASEILTCI